MHAQLLEITTKRKDRLGAQLKFKLLAIAMDCAKFWEYPEEIDQYLIQAVSRIPQSKLFYVIDFQGLQISSNIFPDGSTKRHARGQDLSKRPYTHNIHSEKGFALSPVYLSSVDHKPSITATHPVFHENGNILGFVVADFDIDDFPDNDLKVNQEQSWRQIKGDPAIRKNLFQQERVISAMDQNLDQVHKIITNLVCNRGIFHAKLHYGSSRATLWAYERPYEYQLHVLDEIINPDVCLAYPSHPYPTESTVPEHQVKMVLDRLKDLRNADETVYLRSGSINVINGMVGLTFSCDGSHYMTVKEFLSKADSFWFG
ncbi:PDC sensor domain-containing protein [Cocleimonas sp. KMM 6892]|uniref:PDC sensor domain-containing protein n=1 Tax=unclassified Cocleimonas TaxID=2639732 RepID=UPI002DB5E698|nr:MULTISPECIES: PDC sensor domain-containing protein [unclassified Cocleimonas]MEB8431404.1 PDC sensor domain-containing protein [Cocleimonas sp. KMM 6892]MEC4713824.1 PDC sensor domain-containing protein [Cocleimonas sp. KMM 6895]MEC4743155.1 PDC sensor domain-containing protein [Cocleimonas sp. KMM 6896]